ncbi:MAG: nitrate/sulfonate/bicarbonate ABC transporter ATP-binding protein [Rickettsiales bacterium]|nr:nitrate/sulfonate/bicarbonate ABC transporter ATP-binding protein [Rickettsiales bacterium]
MNNNLIELSSITQSFTKPDGNIQKILDQISFNVREGEILAILGKSGCGKSTLLRIIAGLVKPSRGKVKYNHEATNRNFGISMIFQSFALFPWLTVLENVELGLEALDIPRTERRKKALEAIDLIGLDGFESAMPRELSGGMKQRVGFARALVVEPKVMLMDEPFSALDILTSDTLKNDFLDLWVAKKTDLKSVVIVTHGIEEAVIMADRVLILASNPGRVVSEVKINLNRPRHAHTPEFQQLVDQIYSKMSEASKQTFDDKIKKIREHDITQNLLYTSPNQLAAITSTLAAPPYNGSGDLADLVKALQIKTFDVIHISEALSILKFATVNEGNIKLTKTGKLFATTELDQRKQIFAEQLLKNVPLAAYIVNILNGRADNKAPKSRFLTHLEDQLSAPQASTALKAIIVAGRYAELFSYDDNKQLFSLDNPT